LISENKPQIHPKMLLTKIPKNKRMALQKHPH
jgi:hypothetical protein